MDQLKKDPFFESIDWLKLARKQMKPPQKIDMLPKKNPLARKSMNRTGSQAAQQEDDEIDSMFQEGLSTDTLGAGAAFTDVDYTEDNKLYNRVKNYSFVRT